MENLTLLVTKRTVLGKKTRFLRRQGATPVHVFGHSLESLALQCDTAQLQRLVAQAGRTRLLTLKVEGDKEPRTVFIREVQRNELTRQLLHVDFYQVRKTEKIKVEIPIVFIGEAPAMKGKDNMLTYGVSSLDIECLPGELPPQVEVDLSPLEVMDQAIHVRDIAFKASITVLTDPDQLIVKVSPARVERLEEKAVEKEAVAEAAAEQPEAAAKESAEAEPEAKS